MESFQNMLLAGGHANALGRVNEVIELVDQTPARMSELFECVFADDAWIRMRAMDAFEKLSRAQPDRAVPFLPAIFERLLDNPQPSVQWHLAQLFAEVPLTDKQRRAAINWLKQLLATTEVDWIVSANAMQSLVYFQKHGQTDVAELTPLFSLQTQHASKSIRKKAARFLQELTS